MMMIIMHIKMMMRNNLIGVLEMEEAVATAEDTRLAQSTMALARGNSRRVHRRRLLLRAPHHRQRLRRLTERYRCWLISFDSLSLALGAVVRSQKLVHGLHLLPERRVQARVVEE